MDSYLESYVDSVMTLKITGAVLNLVHPGFQDYLLENQKSNNAKFLNGALDSISCVGGFPTLWDC